MIFKVKKTKDYTVMSNHHLKNINLSLKAKGLLSVMLSLPENWDYSIAGLIQITNAGETAINSCLKELKNEGYLKVDKLMPKKEGDVVIRSKIEYVYTIYESPQKANQVVENLDLENLGLENQGQLITKELSTEKRNTKEIDNESIQEKNIEKKKTPSERELAEEFEEIWKLYPRKEGKTNAMKDYIKARKEGVSFKTVKDGIERYSRMCHNEKKDRQYIKHGDTWFHQRCWEDEFASQFFHVAGTGVSSNNDEIEAMDGGKDSIW